MTPSTSCCYRCIIGAAKLRELGLDEFIDNEAIEFWGGFGIDKVVMSPCSNGEIVSCYCFYPAEKNDLREDGWNISTTPSNLIKTFPNLDPRLHKLFANAEDIKMWRCKSIAWKSKVLNKRSMGSTADAQVEISITCE